MKYENAKDVLPEEYPVDSVPVSKESPRLPDGRYVYSDELLCVMARVAEKRRAYICEKGKERRTPPL